MDNGHGEGSDKRSFALHVTRNGKYCLQSSDQNNADDDRKLAPKVFDDFKNIFCSFLMTICTIFVYFLKVFLDF